MGEVSIFPWERNFGFHLFSGDGKFCYCCEFGDEQRVWEEAFTITLEDPVALSVIQGVLEVLFFHVMVEVVIETGVIDSVYIDMTMGSRKGFLEEGVVSFGVGSMDRIEVF